jgi:hypothetical protein
MPDQAARLNDGFFKDSPALVVTILRNARELREKTALPRRIIGNP